MIAINTKRDKHMAQPGTSGAHRTGTCPKPSSKMAGTEKGVSGVDAKSTGGSKMGGKGGKGSSKSYGMSKGY